MCPKGYDTIAKQIIKNNNYRIIIVVSAIQKTTNMLYKIVDYEEDTYDNINKLHIDLADYLGINQKLLNETLGKLKNDVDDYKSNPLIDATQQKIKIISYGEILSSIILQEYLVRMGFKSKLLNSRNFIKSVNEHTIIDPYNLNIKGAMECRKENIHFLFDKDINIYVTQGFISSTKDNKLCILSRSGSDTSASLIAGALDADRLEIWTDVNGMYTADPRIIPEAQIINEINYEIAQEISASGSYVVHPYSLQPCMEKNIPIYIKNTFDQDSKTNTIINNSVNSNKNMIYSIANQKNVTIYSIKTKDMWNNYGFVADIFKLFSDNCVDVNIITTSQISVLTTTTESSREKRDKLYKVLKAKYDFVDMIENNNIVSIIGNNIQENLNLSNCNKILSELGHEHLRIRHESANGLNLSLVVDNIIAEKLIRSIHREFILKSIKHVDNMDIWWRRKLDTVKSFGNDTKYLYNLEDVTTKCEMLKTNLPCINKFYYAMKANNNESIVKRIISHNFGIECVSYNEVFYAITKCMANDILYTPNYAHLKEYKKVIDICKDKNIKLTVIIDNYLLLDSGIFKNVNVGIRLDLDTGDGHDEKVITEGNNIKFGLPLYDIPKLIEYSKKNDVIIKTLHTHKGSGILNPEAWASSLDKIKSIIHYFPNVNVIDLGGGLGIFNNGIKLDLNMVNNCIVNTIKNDARFNNIELVMEPGRYIVAEAGILITGVTQIRQKGSNIYLGIDTGMNAIIRPALYGSHHPIYNISKIGKKPCINYQVVGNICESGDIIGKNIMLPQSDTDDMIIIENVGAYCQVMSMNYNMRYTPDEYVI